MVGPFTKVSVCVLTNWRNSSDACKPVLSPFFVASASTFACWASVSAGAMVLLLTASSLFAYEFVTFRETSRQQLDTLGKAIAANSTAALAFDNPEDAENVLEAFAAVLGTAKVSLAEANASRPKTDTVMAEAAELYARFRAGQLGPTVHRGTSGPFV